MEINGDFKALVERVREKAQNEADAVIERARKVAERDIRNVSNECKQRKNETEEKLKNAIESEKKASMSDIETREVRTVLKKKEWAVEEVFHRAIKRLSTFTNREERKQLLMKLTEEAVRELAKDSARVQFTPEEYELMKDLHECDGIPVSIEQTDTITSGGPVAMSTDGKVIYENTFDARIERKQLPLRGRIAAILDF